MILIASTGYIPHVGGKSTHITDLKDALNLLNYKTTVVSYTNINKKLTYFTKLLLSPLRMVSEEMYRYYLEGIFDFYMSIIIKKYIKKNRIKFISAQDPQAVNICGKIIKNNDIKISLTMHSYFGLSHDNSKNKKSIDKNYVIKRDKKHLECFRFIKNIISVDSRIKKHCISEIKNYDADLISKIRVDSIVNFTNINKFNIANKIERENSRRKINIDKDKKVLICVRRLVEKNGVIEAVKAMEYVDDNIILLVVGKGPQEENIKNYIKERNLSDKVIMFGQVLNDNIVELYNLADFAIVPSITLNGLQEATSISAIEAMACGLPTIASDIGGLSELITNKQTGILVREKDTKEISKYINILANNDELRNKISFNARNYIEKNNSHIMAAEKYISKFKE
ncbi:glycosyltransferase family 4 protein [Clostridium perfringens]|nr:glycosyltransferase family 4 protein [Clostridium perfringens]MDU2516340.1 glycosyltransferase family 4 protein [Clostridium perfringens]